jgi:hypothetical protein
MKDFLGKELTVGSRGVFGGTDQNGRIHTGVVTSASDDGYCIRILRDGSKKASYKRPAKWVVVIPNA